nr:hypothetical protein GCM10025732_40240 [Glycomyces mayteni]
MPRAEARLQLGGRRGRELPVLGEVERVDAVRAQVDHEDAAVVAHHLVRVRTGLAVGVRAGAGEAELVGGLAERAVLADRQDRDRGARAVPGAVVRDQEPAPRRVDGGVAGVVAAGGAALARAVEREVVADAPGPGEAGLGLGQGVDRFGADVDPRGVHHHRRLAEPVGPGRDQARAAFSGVVAKEVPHGPDPSGPAARRRGLGLPVSRVPGRCAFRGLDWVAWDVRTTRSGARS